MRAARPTYKAQNSGTLWFESYDRRSQCPSLIFGCLPLADSDEDDYDEPPTDVRHVACEELVAVGLIHQVKSITL